MSFVNFREKPIPTHQVGRAECKLYSSYLGTLIVDFNKRCGYCNDTHRYRIRSFAIDHFVPRNPSDFTHPILPNVYNNLVYACNYCNGAKSNKFPSRDHTVHHDGNSGFVMPTTIEYDTLFVRDSTGSILPAEDKALAKFIIKELNLNNPIHSLMWRLEKLVSLATTVKQKVDSTGNPELIELKNQLFDEYFTITQSIFANND